MFLNPLKYLNKDDYSLCVFGKADIDYLESTGLEFKALGSLNDDISMRLAYNIADFFVAPSVQEAFGKTLIKSLVCKKPVVCFDATGPAGIIEDRADGYKAIPFQPEDLARGIDWVLHKSDYKLFSEAVHISALNKFDSAVIAEKYINL